jgi:hypothetical protein
MSARIFVTQPLPVLDFSLYDVSRFLEEYYSPPVGTP